MHNLDLTKRTPGESLWLWRRAHHLSATEAAQNLGLGRTSLWGVERGSSVVHRRLPKVRRPALPLLLRLARRRSGMSLERVARGVGCSRTTLLKWEAGGSLAGAARVRGFWEHKGYRFG